MILTLIHVAERLAEPGANLGNFALCPFLVTNISGTKMLKFYLLNLKFVMINTVIVSW